MTRPTVPDVLRPTRRGLMAGAAALAALGLAPRTGRAQPAPRIVVVGGGWGGLSAARHLREALPAAEITLIEPNGAFMSCPLSVHYLVGDRTAESLTFDLGVLARENTRHLRTRAETVDRDAREVVTPEGRVPYDFLVLSPGIDYIEDAIEGFAAAREQIPVAFRAFEQSALRARLEAFEGGDMVLSVPALPYRCPIAPYERAALFADWMDRRGLPGRVILLDQNPDIPIGKPAIEGAFAELFPDRIEHRKGVAQLAIDVGARTVTADGETIPYALAALVPPMKAAGILNRAGLAQRWAPVRFPQFLAAEDDDIYIIGDSVASTLPKSGHVAFEAGLQVARHIAARARDEEADADDDSLPSAICFAFFNATEAMAVNIANSWNGLTNEIERRAQVDAVRSAAAGQQAHAWAEQIWRQLVA